jgi:cell division ATPase FtsA
MSLFSLNNKSERFGVLIDIGSGSVLTAIVASDPQKSHPEILWSHREHAPLKNIDSIQDSAKAVMTALMNSLMKLDGEGRQCLHASRSSARLTEVQTCISAPWSYTVTKTINYKQEEDFEITDSLIDELVRTAMQKTTDELSEQDSVNRLGLTIITRITMDIIANGYRVKSNVKGDSKNLSVTHSSVVTQQYLVEIIDDLKSKLFSGVPNNKLSYILALFCVIQDLFPQTTETCLIDITYEASEIGIVRDGSLNYSTHTPFGSFSLAREIANITGVPLYEAFQYLHTETPYSFMDSLYESQKEDVEMVFSSYVEKLASLFKETGDELSIPKKIYLHVDLQSEPLFKDLVEKAVMQSIKSPPDISLVTPKIVTSLKPDGETKLRSKDVDTAMLVSAMFFHKQNHCHGFEYL